ncbi:hypothetical protein Tco_0994573 [Tanacetum coccineum]
MPHSTYMKLTDERPAETDIKLSLENERRPFILGTPFLTTAKASIKFDTGTITLRSGKSKASPGMRGKDKASLRKGNAVQPIEEKIFKSKHPPLIAIKERIDDE